MHRLARVLAPDRARAEDLLQETYLRGLRYFDSYRGEQDIRAWLAGIMRNLQRDAGPARTGPLVEAEDLPDPGPDPEAIAIAADRAARLRGHIAALPDGLRETLLLREFTGLSYAAVAAAQAIPIGTVMSRLARARAMLREAMDP
jgi:RNA polymerase sigma-70 factor, ECF subfamily